MLASRPWHFRSMRDESIRGDLAMMLERGVTPPPGHIAVMGRGVVSVHPRALAGPGVVMDVQDGDVVVDADAVIRPGAIIIGPAYVGPSATVLDRATIRPNTAIGPWCKVNGELTGVIMQAYSNKAHEGFLGDSWVGEWVNLGAGTTNSNLLNTYGEIVSRARPDGPNERTGEKFLGAVLGDHVKTAICTRMMTGAIVHTGVMWAAAGAISGCVAPFTWGTDDGHPPRQFRLTKFLETARAMMARRHEDLSPAEEARLSELHAAAAAYFNTAP
jgi:UDP-N-acetylglucosamine diphosphorylase/glucosamine-1-phosphate N-acetyltransferase